MSTTIDERVVEMTFDNKQFEKNVKESMSTIDKLKEKLNFKGMKDGLDDFQESASKFDLDEMEKAADSVSLKFTALEAVGLRVIQRITDAAFDAGVSMVKSLSVDNISAGWSKYEAKTANVQTIMNSTGKSIDEVNQYLSKLMWFSDETSFSFSDMTTALATMTASGADIDTIIPTIMGIAEATAYAGKTSSEFGRVIYNLTQSYSQGYLNAMDWKSVALAGVNSKQLIESLITAGEEVGTIKKGQVTVENFTGSLSDLKWANTKVMEKAFSKWSSMMTDAYTLVNGDNAEFDTAAEAIKSLSGQYEQYIEDATVAAQSAKSFAEAIAATQDAVSSGWLKTFETIFGDYEEGKKLWSDITEEFWEIFAASRDERNDVLKAWKELGGRDLIFANTEESTGAFWTLYYSIKDITDAIGNGFREIFPKQTADQLYQITENIKEFTEKLQLSEESLEKIQNISSKVFGVIKYTLADIGSIISYIYKVLAKPIIVKIFDMLPIIGNKFIVPIYRALNTLYGVIVAIIDDFGSKFKDVISDISGAAKGTISLSSIIEKIGKIIVTIIGYTATLLYQIHESELAISIIKGIANVITTVIDIIKTLFDLISGKSKWSDFVSSFAEIGKNIVIGLGNGIKNTFNIIVEVIKSLANFVINIFKSILGIHSPSTVFEEFGKNIGQGLINGIKKISQVVFDTVTWLGDKIADIFSKISNKSFGPLGSFVKGLTDIFKALWEGLKWVWDLISPLVTKLGGLLSYLANSIINFVNGVEGSNFKDIIQTLLFGYAGFGIGEILDGIGKAFIGFGDFTKRINKILKAFSYVLDSISDVLYGFAFEMKAKGIAEIIKSVGIALLEIAAAIVIISFIDVDQLKASATTIITILTELIGAILGALYLSNTGKGPSSTEGIKLSIKETLEKSTLIRSLGKALVKMAIAILIIVASMKILSSIKPEEMWRAFGVIEFILATFVGIIYAINKIDVDEKKLVKSAAAMLIMSAALLLMVDICLLMTIVPWTGMKKTAIMMIGFLLIFAGAIYLFSKIDMDASDMVKLTAAMAIFAGVLVLLTAISILMYLVSWTSMEKLAVLMIGTILIFAVAINQFKSIASSTTDIIKAMAALSIFAGIIALLTVISLLLTFVSWDTLGKLGVVMGGVVVALAAVCAIALIPDIGSKLLSLSAGFAAFAGAIALLGVGIAAIAIGLKILTDLSGTFIEPLRQILDEIVNFIFSLAVSIVDAFIANIQKIAEALPLLKEAIVSIISTLVSTVLTAISNTTNQIVDTFLTLILTVLNKLADYIGPIVDALFDILINAALAMVEKLPELISIVMDMIVQVLTLVSENLQNFSILDLAEIMVQIGEIEAILLELAVVFGTAWLLNGVLSTCAENLTDFGIKIMPFLMILSSVDPKVIESAHSLAETILILTGSSILDAIGSFLGGKDISAFGEEFAKLGPGLKAFGDSVKDVDVDTVQKASIAAQSIAAFVSDIPREGGLLQKIIGEIDFKGFAEGLAEFGPAFATYAESVKDIDKATIQNSTEAAMFIAKFAKEIPNSGGLLADLLGDNTLSDFGEQLKVFGPAFAEFAQQMVGIDKSVVETASEAALTVAKFAKEVPNNGGALAKLLGDNRLDDFGEQLKSFGPNFANYAKKMTGVSKATVERASSAALTVAKFAKEIPNSGGALGWLVGDNRLDDFGAQLPKFGEGFAGFISALDGVEVDLVKVTMCEMVASMMAALENNLPRTGGVVQWFIGQKDLGYFGEQLADFGTGMAAYMNAISEANYDTEKVAASIMVALELSKINEKTSVLSTLISWITGETALSQLGEGLIPLAAGMSAYMDSISNTSFDEAKIKASVNAAVALSTINDHTSALSALVEWFTGDTAYEKLAAAMPALADGLVAYGTAIKDAGFTLSDMIIIKKSADIATALSTISENTSALDTIIGWVGGKTSMKVFADNLESLGTGLVAYANALTDGDFDSSKIEGSANIVTKLAAAYNDISGSNNFFDWLSKLTGDSMSTFASNLPKLAQGITDYAKIVSKATISVSTAKPIKKAALDGMSNTLVAYEEVVTQAVDFNSADISASVDMITKLSELTKLKSVWEDLVDWITGSGIEEDFTEFGNGLRKLGGGISAFAGQISDLFGTEYNSDKTAILVNKAEQFKTIVEAMVTVADIAMSEDYLAYTSPNQVSSWDYMSRVGADLKDFYDQVKDFSVSKITNVEKVIKAISNALEKSDLGLTSADILSNIYAVGKKLISNMSKGMTSDDAESAVISSVKSIIQLMVDYFNGKAPKSDYTNGITPISKMYNIGKNLILGLSDGMNDPEAVAAISGSAKLIGEGTINKFTTMYEINSPSKVMYGIGKYLTEGMALGIVDSEGANMLTSSIAKIVNLVENNVDAQPTIRPVMDLTEIQNGVRLANSVTAGLNGVAINSSYNMASDTAYRANLRQASINNSSNVNTAQEVGRILGEVVASSGSTFNNTFNITGDNPEEIAEQVSRIILEEVERKNSVWE